MATPAEDVEAPSEDLLLSEPTIAELAMLDETGAPEMQATESQPTPQEPEEPVKQDLGATGGDDKTIKATGAEMKPKPANVRPLPRQYLVVTKDKDSNDPDTRLTAARRALTQGNNSAALQMFNDLYADNPRDTRVLLGRAVAYQRLGQRDMAIAAYEETLRRDPQRLDALTNFLGLLREQNPELALQKLQELRATYPSNADISAQLGLAYGDMGDYDRALSHLDTALTLAPNDASYLFNKAVILDRMGKRVEAADMYREVLKQADPNTSLPIESIRNRLSVIR
jgi:tetratricopeptide (TPR) repeat protein